MPKPRNASSGTLLWFREDLRLDDHPALLAAVATSEPVIPVFLGPLPARKGWSLGAASRWWLHHSLLSLQANLDKRGSRLILRRGQALAALSTLARETGATRVFWTRSLDPDRVREDEALAKHLEELGVQIKIFSPNVLFPQDGVFTAAGKPVQVFSAYWKKCLAQYPPARPAREPRTWRSPQCWPVSESLATWALLPKHPWAEGLAAQWTPGEQGAQRALKRFVRSALEEYATARDLPAKVGTSRLSPHLRWGEIGVRRIWETMQIHAHTQGANTFLRQLGWREFAQHLLWHFPHTPEQPLRPLFARFPWRENAKILQAWQQGRTGYPLVDAGMRELWATGWMHNRVRMIVASLLTKHLLQPWPSGARWFWDTLVDAELGNNTLGWQWVAGCGADAAPYFRIFNPSLQGQRFDGDGEYVRRWVPELKALPNRWLHRPWEAPESVLNAAGVQLGREYPWPIVSHADGRKQALAAYQVLKQGRETLRFP